MSTNNDLNLRKICKFRLKARQNPEYLRYLDSIKKPGVHKAHFAGKRNDLQVSLKTFDEHINQEHFKGESDEVEDFINSTELVFDYVEHLQNKLKEQK